MTAHAFTVASIMAAAGLLTITVATNSRAQGTDVPQVALVGGAHIHTPEFIDTLNRRKNDVKVKYVWDEDAQRARQRAQALGGVQVVEDVQKIWNDPSIKAVIICSETERHEPLILAAAKAKKHVYAEKPLGIGARDAYAMAKALDDASVIFQTGYFMRGDPKLIFLKDQVGKHAFGTITRIRGCNAHNGALGGWFDTEWRWMADPKQAGVGGYGDLGTHSLDLMLWLLGDDVRRTTAAVSNGTARYPGCDELGEGLLVWNNGTIGTLAASWDDVSNPVTLEICGTEGHAVIMNDKLYFRSKHVQGSDDKQPWTQLPRPWPRPMDNFLDAITGKSHARLITADEAAYRSAVMEALYTGARQQKWTEPQQPLMSK